MKRTISIAKGKGSISHNLREFRAENVDSERVHLNTCFVNEDIKRVYHNLFDTALEEYNAKQKRNDRKIHNYYEKIRTSKQEKLFYEIIVQVGNFEDMSATDKNGKLAEKILHEYMTDFQERNPTLYVFSAHLHMDEATPHLHIDFIPYTNGNKRGLETKNTLKGALEKLGFKGGTRGNTELNQWKDAEKQKLAEIMLEYNIEWDKKDSNKEHLSVLDYKKEKRIQEVKELDHIVEIKQAEIIKLQENIATEKFDFGEIKAKKIRINDIDSITVKNALLDGNKVIINKSEFEDIKVLAKKHIASNNKEKKLVSEVKALSFENLQLKQENNMQKQELLEYQSVKNRLNVGKIKLENEKLKISQEKTMKFLEIFDLKEQFNKFIAKNTGKEQ